MELRRFLFASFNDRQETIAKHGQLINDRIVQNRSKVSLFRVNGFYAEVFYDLRSDVVQKITPISEADVQYYYYSEGHRIVDSQ